MRDGETSAFAPLWVRHADAARRIAGRIPSTVGPDDLLAQAYTQILTAVRTGNGPTTAFRPYLYATMRIISRDAAARNTDHEAALTADGGLDTAIATDDDLLDRTIFREAFGDLDPQWRTALWLTEVEGMAACDVALATGQTPDTVAAETYRAREALMAAWLTARVREPHPTDRCPWAIDKLAHDRPLRRRVRRQLDEHVATCGHCAGVESRLGTLRPRLRGPLLALLLGPTDATSPLPEPVPSALALVAGPAARPFGEPGAREATRSSRGFASGIAAMAAAAATAVALAGIASDLVSHAPAAGTPDLVTVAEPAPPAAPPVPTPEPAPALDPDSTREAEPDSARDPEPRPAAAPPPADVPAPAPEPQPTDVPEVVMVAKAPPDAAGAPERVGRRESPVERPTAVTDTSFQVEAYEPGGLLLPEVSGTAEPGTVVDVVVDDEVAASVPVGDDGAWKAVIDATPGKHVLAVQPADAPNEQIGLGTVLLLAPSVTAVQHEGTAQPTLVLRGEPGSTLAAAVDGAPTGTLHELGHASIRRQLPELEPGTSVVSLRYVDGNGRYGAALERAVGVGTERPGALTTPL